ncbi:phosphatase PAP2 family protein [Nonomuraea soli]|uniref:Membrane-associated phospholipid phosphatase n=1 Tax=Nonomuraea soli TaxID=1032476 RepID=A0A7W0CEF0_9ACTN|nr:phosphatase PAP2 family protein [Nonomuraea soli]MBA2889641.1 membrane-associated phospholipid phosphatase [Nonomuraea soli]
MSPLDDLRAAELDPIVWLQSLPTALEPVMEFVSLFGTETFFLFLLPLFYWCVSPRAGLLMGAVVLASASTNLVGKLLFHAPRPYWIDARIRPLGVEEQFGMPSGHAQIATATWGALASLVRRPWAPWAWWAAGVITALIALSRVYLGVHFISDVVLGVVLGLGVLLAVLGLEGRVTRWWLARSLWAQLLFAAAVSGIMIGAAVLANLPHDGWTLPQAWAAAGRIDPENLDYMVALSGSALGMLAGVALMWRLGWFTTAGPVRQRVLRWALGSAVVGLLWYGTRELLPDDSAWRYLRYAAISLWVQLGAPLTFIALGLMTREKIGARAP